MKGSAFWLLFAMKIESWRVLIAICDENENLMRFDCYLRWKWKVVLFDCYLRWKWRIVRFDCYLRWKWRFVPFWLLFAMKMTTCVFWLLFAMKMKLCMFWLLFAMKIKFLLRFFAIWLLFAMKTELLTFWLLFAMKNHASRKEKLWFHRFDCYLRRKIVFFDVLIAICDEKFRLTTAITRSRDSVQKKKKFGGRP